MTTTRPTAPAPESPESPAPRARPTRSTPGAASGVPWLASALVALAAALVLLDTPATPAVQVAAGLLLLGTPVVVLARRLPWDLDSAVHAWVLAVGLTVVGVLTGGLLLNTVLPWVGVDRPLAVVPLTSALLVVDLALVVWRHHVPLVAIPLSVALRRVVRLRLRLLPTLAVLAVVVSVAGAVRLNNDAGGGLAVAGHVLVVVLVGAALLARGDDVRRDSLAVYAAGLSLLLATSLRSWYVSGHDVQREFISFQLTQGLGRWSMEDYQTAYHACLSVNILPTVIADVTGLSGAVVFKVVLQVLAAALPVVVLLLARVVLDRRLALGAAAVFIAFPTFSTDLPYLVRQEVAFLLLGLALLVASQAAVRPRTRRVLVLVLGSGVVLSHYSTTYVTLAMLLVGLVALSLTALGERALAWVRTRRGQRGVRPSRARETRVVLHLPVVAALVAVTWLWVSPVTGSGGHLLDTARTSVANLVDGGGGPSSTDVSLSVLPGQEASPQERLDLYSDEVLERRDPGLDYLLPAQGGAVSPPVVTEQPAPLTALGRALDVVVPVSALNGLLRTGAALALQVLLMVGLVAVVLRRRARPRGVRDLDDQTRALMVGAVAGVGLVVVVPGLSAEYGVLRAFQQGLVLLAPLVVIGLVTLVGVIRPLARHVTAVVAGSVLAMLLVLTGVVSTLTGGATGLLALSDEGPYVQLHYITDAEMAGYRWLGRNAGGRVVQAEVVSDKLAANRLRYNPEGGVLVAGDLFPAGLLSGAAIFLGPDTVHDGVAAQFYTGAIIDYRFPADRVEHRQDVVFSSPDARIYW